MLGPQSLPLLSWIATGSDGDGAWVFVGNFRPPMTVINLGLVSGDKTQIWVSGNPADTPPTAYTAAQGAIQSGSDITADGATAITTSYSWISIRKTAHLGGGTIVTRLVGLVV
jgi:hypothetical protein